MLCTAIAISVVATLTTTINQETMTVDGIERKFIVASPVRAKGAPVALVFHGHFGSAENAIRRMNLHAAWPEALVIYPQGLPTSTPNDAEGKGTGWQPRLGANDDRDLKFFDALVQWASDQSADSGRVFVSGHSNGGSFTYLLWQSRPSKLAAVAPSAAVFSTQRVITQPLPALIIVGEGDTVVPTDRQLRGIERAKALNGVGSKSQPWNGADWFDGKSPLVVLQHGQGHQFPASAAKTTAAFFKQISASRHREPRPGKTR